MAGAAAGGIDGGKQAGGRGTEVVAKDGATTVVATVGEDIGLTKGTGLVRVAIRVDGLFVDMRRAAEFGSVLAVAPGGKVADGGGHAGGEWKCDVIFILLYYYI